MSGLTGQEVTQISNNVQMTCFSSGDKDDTDEDDTNEDDTDDA